MKLTQLKILTLNKQRKILLSKSNYRQKNLFYWKFLIFRFVLNSDIPDQSESNIHNQNSTFPESTSLSDLTDDDKRKFHHSDSFYLLRKKVKNENDNTSDDESQLSTIDEKMLDGV